MATDWPRVPFGHANRLAILVGTVVPMLTHPGELLAAAVWFSMVTWLMLRTRNIWDCVIAHAVTNGILGLYVVFSDTWRLM
jgi:membrane protease YdiL (CAAX protease family)